MPHYLSEADHPWLRALLDEYERFSEKPRRELREHLRQPLPRTFPPGKRRLAARVLDRLCRDLSRCPVTPRRARMLVFTEAIRHPRDRCTAIAVAASELGVSPSELEESLFADLGDERLVALPEKWPSPAELAARTNLYLAQGLLYRASSIAIQLKGNARSVVRHALLRQLICTVEPAQADSDCTLRVSGPVSLFRHTLIYGRRLSGLLPFLAWCDRFRLRAECRLNERATTLEIRSGDPIFPASEPRRYDSKLEQRFARDFLRLAPEWDLIREPEPVKAVRTLVFPDFAIQHRAQPSRRWLLEIVGFWTPDYIRHKLTRLRAARLKNFIVCLATKLNCTDGELPEGASVIPFDKRVDPRAVLKVIESEELAWNCADR